MSRFRTGRTIRVISALLSLVAFSQGVAAYAGAASEGDPIYPPGRAKSDLWCRHIVLVYTYPSGHLPDFWTADRFKWLAAYRSTGGECKDFLFDGFLILGFGAKEGRHLLDLSNRKPAIKSDWEDAINAYLGAASKLSEAFLEVSKELGSPHRKAKIIVAIPYPDWRNRSFGPVNGKMLDLSIRKPERRVEAVKWYIAETLERWDELAEQGKLAGAKLVGFYWGREGISGLDDEVIKDVASYIHDEGYLLHWIPSFGGARKDWRELGLDCVTQQLNYQNPARPGRPLTIFDDMCKIVAEYGLHGVEMTPMARKVSLNPRVWCWHQVFLANLEAALRLKWQKFDAITYFHGNSLSGIAADPKTRIFYDNLYKWTRGRLTWQDLEELAEVVTGELKSQGVLSARRLKEITEAGTILRKLHLMERPDGLREAMLAAEREKIPPANPIGEEWLSVTGDDPDGGDVKKHRPGVCFLTGLEWDLPAMHDGKMARRGGFYPGMGGPNFLVNEPSERGIEVRITYWSKSGGTLRVYDGEKYHDVADLSHKGSWATAIGRVLKDIILNPKSDRREPGLNILFEVRCDDVYVHKIEVRAARKRKAEN